MAVPEDKAAELLARCGRCCCICRRFRPTLLQVHHIVERAEGGSDEIENLIALCITCHSDVHTKRPFTRRFSRDELMRHRDAVVDAVVQGQLVPPDTDTEQPAVAVTQVHSYTPPVLPGEPSLSTEAVVLLLGAADGGNGRFFFASHSGGIEVQAGSLHKDLSYGREEAAYQHAAAELVGCGLTSLQSNQNHCLIWNLTLKGYQAADTLAAASEKMSNRLN